MTAPAPFLTLKKDLTLTGLYGYQIQQDRIIITIDQIESHRDIGNLSGTIALELRGYTQDGQTAVLASTTIGQLSGQHFLAHCEYDLIFTPPPSGQWQLALELREWNGVQYDLIDQALFDQTYCVEEPTKTAKEAVVATENNVIVADFTPVDDVATSVEAESTTQPIARIDAPKHSKAAELNKPAESSKKKAKASKSSKQERILLSVNQSSLEELSNVKGLPKKVAKEIVDSRPHSTWESLLKLKGMGPKLLKKLKEVSKLK